MKKKLFSDLILSLKEIGWDISMLLNKPLEKHSLIYSKLRQLYNFQNIEISSIENLYSICDGMKMTQNDIQKSYLAPHIYFNSIIESMEIVEADEFYKFKEKRLLPLFQSFFGEYIAVKLYGEAELYYCSTFDYEIDNIVSIYDNIESMFVTLNTFIKEKMIIVDDDGYLVLNVPDYESYLILGMKYNPNSNYWKQKIKFFTESG